MKCTRRNKADFQTDLLNFGMIKDLEIYIMNADTNPNKYYAKILDNLMKKSYLNNLKKKRQTSSDDINKCYFSCLAFHNVGTFILVDIFNKY